MSGALSGIRILDFTRMHAGPICTMFMAELGAEVIKVEMRGSGDANRQIPPITDGGESHIYAILNRGKKSITLDTRTEEGRKIALELIAKSDVLIENYAPGVMKRMGLEYDAVTKVNSKIIYVSISGFGQSGPNSSRVSYDIVAQAMGGLMSVTGFPENPPTKCGPAIADQSGGFFASMGIMAALLYRNSSDQGQYLDISLQDCVWLQTSIEALPFYIANKIVPRRLGNTHEALVPWNLYKAKDGYVVIACITIGQWQKLANIMRRADLISDPDKLSLVYRVQHRDKFDSIVAEWTTGFTVAELQKLMDDAGLACSPVMDTAQILNDPHMNSREMIIEIEQSLSGKLKSPGTVFKMSKTPGNPLKSAAFLGEHNAEIYGNLLGYSELKIRELMDKEII